MYVIGACGGFDGRDVVESLHHHSVVPLPLGKGGFTVPYIFRAGMETRPYGTVFVDYFVGASIARPECYFTTPPTANAATSPIMGSPQSLLCGVNSQWRHYLF